MDEKPSDLKQACIDLVLEANSLGDKLRESKIKELGLLDKQFDSDFKDFVFVASKICKTNVSQINLFDADHQIIKVRIDREGPLIGPKSDSICAITTIQCPDTVTVIPDAKLDNRVNQTSWVKNNIVRFYAGAPLIIDGIAIGTLCVFDDKEPRNLSEDQRETLRALARLVSSMLVKVK